MGKILVINSNTNSDTTRALTKKLQPHAGKDTEITCLNPAQGPWVIDTLLDASIGAIETVRLVAQNRQRYDAFIIACGLDPGLEPCRSIVRQPVIGMAEAGFLTACTLCRKFTVLTHTALSVSIMEELVCHYGLEKRLASVRAIDMSGSEMADHDRMVQRMEEEIRLAVTEDKGELIVLPGIHWVGLEKDLSGKLGVPVLSGLVCALKMAEFLIDYGQQTSKLGPYQRINKHDPLTGYEDLQGVFSI